MRIIVRGGLIVTLLAAGVLFFQGALEAAAIVGIGGLFGVVFLAWLTGDPLFDGYIDDGDMLDDL